MILKSLQAETLNLGSNRTQATGFEESPCYCRSSAAMVMSLEQGWNGLGGA